MPVFSKGGHEIDYGIRITYTDSSKKPKEKWYGSDSLKRDSAHNLYAQRSNVAIVQDIQQNK